MTNTTLHTTDGGIHIPGNSGIGPSLPNLLKCRVRIKYCYN